MSRLASPGSCEWRGAYDDEDGDGGKERLSRSTA